MGINPRTGIPRGLELPQYLDSLAQYRRGHPIVLEPKKRCKNNVDKNRRKNYANAYKDGRKCGCGKPICNQSIRCKACWARVREQTRRESAQDKTLGMFDDLPNRVADFVRSLTSE